MIIELPQLQDGITIERQKIILAELRSPQQLSEVLDVIDVVLGFLASAGAGNPHLSLGNYLKKTLKMARRTLPKVSWLCSLWIFYNNRLVILLFCYMIIIKHVHTLVIP